MGHWLSGYTQLQLDEAQERYDLRFPPDLIDLYRERRPAVGYAWHTEDPHIREMLAWPYDLLLFDVEQGFWWPDWGERPSTPEQRAEALRSALRRVSRLIPIIAHRFIPETPGVPGNPVFSMHGFDTIYYGADLADYFHREFHPAQASAVPLRHDVRHIPFWSDIVERPDVPYADFEAAASEAPRVGSGRSRTSGTGGRRAIRRYAEPPGARSASIGSAP
jgi:hypothetical protein